MNNSNPNTTQNNDEIDLFELCITLWKGKWLIIAITSFCTLLAILVAFVLLKPIYQAQITIAPPYTYQINELNEGLILNSNSNSSLDIILPSDVYHNLINMLYSTNIQREFFIQHYIPKQTDPNKIKISQENFEQFQKTLSIAQKNKDTDLYTLSLTSHTPHQSYDLIQEFLQFVNNKALDITIKNRIAETNALINNTESQLNNLRLSISSETSNEINRLQSALEIATSLDLEAPMEQPIDLYMQGTKALKGKISYLTENKNNFSLNPQFRELTTIINFYKTAHIPNESSLILYNIDSAAYLPEKPIKPNKKLIVIIGFLLGGMLSILIVLIRQAIRNRYPKDK